MPMRPKHSTVLTLAVLTCAGPSFAEDIARVLSVEGVSVVQRLDARPRILGSSDTLAREDVINVGPTSHAIIEFTDQTQITLRPGTVFRMDALSSNRPDSLLKGLIKGGMRGASFDARWCEDDCIHELPPATPNQPKPVARVVEMKGRAAAAGPGGSSRLLVPGAAIYEREGVATGTDSYAVLVFSDGSRISLAENSRFAVNRFEYAQTAPREGKAYLTLLAGNAQVWTGRLAKISPDAFLFESAMGVIRPHGTGFNVGGCIANACGSASVNVDSGGASASGSASVGSESVSGTVSTSSSGETTAAATVTTSVEFQAVPLKTPEELAAEAEAMRQQLGQKLTEGKAKVEQAGQVAGDVGQRALDEVKLGAEQVGDYLGAKGKSAADNVADFGRMVTDKLVSVVGQQVTGSANVDGETPDIRHVDAKEFASGVGRQVGGRVGETAGAAIGAAEGAAKGGKEGGVGGAIEGAKTGADQGSETGRNMGTAIGGTIVGGVSAEDAANASRQVWGKVGETLDHLADGAKGAAKDAAEQTKDGFREGKKSAAKAGKDVMGQISDAGKAGAEEARQRGGEAGQWALDEVKRGAEQADDYLAAKGAEVKAKAGETADQLGDDIRTGSRAARREGRVATDRAADDIRKGTGVDIPRGVQGKEIREAADQLGDDIRAGSRAARREGRVATDRAADDIRTGTGADIPKGVQGREIREAADQLGDDIRAGSRAARREGRVATDRAADDIRTGTGVDIPRGVQGKEIREAADQLGDDIRAGSRAARREGRVATDRAADDIRKGTGADIPKGVQGREIREAADQLGDDIRAGSRAARREGRVATDRAADDIRTGTGVDIPRGVQGKEIREAADQLGKGRPSVASQQAVSARVSAPVGESRPTGSLSSHLSATGASPENIAPTANAPAAQKIVATALSDATYDALERYWSAWSEWKGIPGPTIRRGAGLEELKASISQWMALQMGEGLTGNMPFGDNFFRSEGELAILITGWVETFESQRDIRLDSVREALSRMPHMPSMAEYPIFSRVPVGLLREMREIFKTLFRTLPPEEAEAMNPFQEPLNVELTFEQLIERYKGWYMSFTSRYMGTTIYPPLTSDADYWDPEAALRYIVRSIQHLGIVTADAARAGTRVPDGYASAWSYFTSWESFVNVNRIDRHLNYDTWRQYQAEYEAERSERIRAAAAGGRGRRPMVAVWDGSVDVAGRVVNKGESLQATSDGQLESGPNSSAPVTNAPRPDLVKIDPRLFEDWSEIVDGRQSREAEGSSDAGSRKGKGAGSSDDEGKETLKHERKDPKNASGSADSDPDPKSGGDSQGGARKDPRQATNNTEDEPDPRGGGESSSGGGVRDSRPPSNDGEEEPDPMAERAARGREPTERGLYVWARDGVIKLNRGGKAVEVAAGNAIAVTKDQIAQLDYVPNFMRFDRTPRPDGPGRAFVPPPFVMTDGSVAGNCVAK